MSDLGHPEGNEMYPPARLASERASVRDRERKSETPKNKHTYKHTQTHSCIDQHFSNYLIT